MSDDGKILKHPGVSRQEYLRDPDSSMPGVCFRDGFEAYRRALSKTTMWSQYSSKASKSRLAAAISAVALADISW